MAQSKLLHEYPCSYISYEEMMAELNKIKAQLPKNKWKNIYFEVEEKYEIGTYDKYTAFCIYYEE